MTLKLEDYKYQEGGLGRREPGTFDGECDGDLGQQVSKGSFHMSKNVQVTWVFWSSVSR